MSAALLRSRLDGSGLKRIGLLSHRIHASRSHALTRHVTHRTAFHAPRRRPVPQCPALRSFQLNAPLSLRHKPEAVEKIRRSRGVNAVLKIFTFLGIFVVSTGVVVVGFFIYDATTYREEPSAEDIPVSQLALSPRRGGPKNLPIAEVLVGDQDSQEMAAQKDRPKLVVLGTGWGSVALLKHLRPGDYHVTVVSPQNYFLFTPMLPSATVGTLGFRSLVEPIRRITRRVHGHFLKGEAEDVDFTEKLVEVSQVDADGNKQHFYLPYDKLVIGVGMLIHLHHAHKMISFSSGRFLTYRSKKIPGCVTNPHGVKGLEYCSYLKSIDDARKIKNRVLENLELACLPTTSDEERKRLLSFVVCGGGPTGVEFAAELYDLLNEDLLNQFPKIIRNEISVHVIQSRSHILNTYDEALSRYAEVCSCCATHLLEDADMKRPVLRATKWMSSQILV